MLKGKCVDKNALKERMHKKIDEVIDDLDTIGKMNFFEVTFKHINGDLNMKMGITDVEKVKR